MPPHTGARTWTDRSAVHRSGRPVPQQPTWPDLQLLNDIQHELSTRPPLVPPAETVLLTEQLAAVAQRRAIAIQGGDCAELFADAEPTLVHRKLQQLYAHSVGISDQVGTPVLTMARMAGQYAKPRSSEWEALDDGQVIHEYRGDAVNSIDRDAAARIPNARRLLDAYDCAAATLKLIRESWQGRPDQSRVFASHELLLLPYEYPQVHGEPRPYLSSTHFGWIGDRTRDPDGAHVALAGSVHNPIGIKVGPASTAESLVRIARLLNPERLPGRLTFIVRMGATRIDERLPNLIRAIEGTGIPVAWLSDPMHGNTTRTERGRKTRSIRSMLDELTAFVRILRSYGAWPGGVHLEMTPEPVTECVARTEDAPSAELPDYRSPCDPRLNAEQTAEVIDGFVSLLRQS